MKYIKLYIKLYITLLIFSAYIFPANSYAKEDIATFTLIEKEVQNGLNKKIQYGLAKKTMSNPILRGLSFSSASSQVEIIPPIYDAIEEIYGDFFAILKDKQMGLAKKDGKILFEAKYDYISLLGENLFVLLKNNKTGIAKRNGEILLDTTCSYIPKYDGEFALVNSYFRDTTGRSTLLNKKGEIVLDIKHNILFGSSFSGINHLGNNFYNFLKGSWGLTDELGNIIINPDESDYGFIIPADLIAHVDYNPKNYIIKSFILNKAKPYQNANSTPRTLKWHNVDAISYIGNDLFLYFKDKKFGIINRKREIVKHFIYDKMSVVDNTYLLLENSKNKDIFKMKTSEALSLKHILSNVEI